MPDRIPDDPLRQGDLNSTHDRYEWSLAWPSDQTLHYQFIILATINAMVATACFILILSILRYRKVRDNPFNLYLLFIALPDLLSSFLCLITCAMSAAKNQFYSEAMCAFQSWYLVFGFTANCWMNGVIVYEIHRLLRESHYGIHYHPPTRKKVFLQAGVVYLYALLWGFLGVWSIPGMPHESLNYYGLNCFPKEYDKASTFFYWLVFIPCFMILPICYANYVCFDVLRKKMLPPRGRRRDLALYFTRLLVVYFGMWIPFLIVCTVGSFVQISPWLYYVGAAWSHFQGLVSVVVATTRPQIKKAIVDCLRCVKDEPPSESELESSSASLRRRRPSLTLSLMKSSVFKFRSSRRLTQLNSLKENGASPMDSRNRISQGLTATPEVNGESQISGEDSRRWSSGMLVLEENDEEEEIGSTEHKEPEAAVNRVSFADEATDVKVLVGRNENEEPKTDANRVSFADTAADGKVLEGDEGESGAGDGEESDEEALSCASDKL